VQEPGEDAWGRPRQVDAEQFMQLSEALRRAFAEVSAAGLLPADAARWQRRLIAITNAAKRDLPRALEQMRRFEADWRRVTR
jgi:transposase